MNAPFRSIATVPDLNSLLRKKPEDVKLAMTDLSSIAVSDLAALWNSTVPGERELALEAADRNREQSK